MNFSEKLYELRKKEGLSQKLMYQGKQYRSGKWVKVLQKWKN